MAWKTRTELGIGEKMATRLREQNLVHWLERGVMGRGFYYDDASFEKYLESKAQKAKPPELPFEILKKEVKREFQFIKGGANMSKKWEKEVSKETGLPTGRLRHQGHGFSIVKDPKKKFGFQYSLDIRHPRRSTFGLRKLAGRPIENDADALNVAYKFVTKQFDNLASSQNPDPTFTQMISDHEEDLIGRDRKTAKDMAKRARSALEPHFGPLKASAIRLHPHIVAFRDKRREAGVKDSTIANDLAIARALFNVAKVKGRVKCENPFKEIGIHLGLNVKLRTRWMLPEEKERLWPVIEKIPPMLDMAIVALNTGIRPGNLIKLIWRQIRWSEERPYIFISKDGSFISDDHHKTDDDATHPINETAMKILKRLYEENPNEPDDRVFMRRDRRGRLIPITKNWYQKEWRKACAKAGIKNLRFYDLKHTLGTALAAKNVSAFVIKDTFNHAKISSTERYVKSNKAAVAEALKKVEHALNGVSL